MCIYVCVCVCALGMGSSEWERESEVLFLLSSPLSLLSPSCVCVFLTNFYFVIPLTQPLVIYNLAFMGVQECMSEQVRGCVSVERNGASERERER